MSMKVFFKKAVALTAIAALLLTFSACGEKPAEKETTDAVTEPVLATSEATVATTEEETFTLEPTVEASTVEKTTVLPETTTVAPTTKATTTNKVTTTKSPTTIPAVTVPTAKADILALYNAAAAKVSTAKPGFKKSTVTKIPSLEMGALAKLDVVRTAVGDFLGEGSSNNAVAKGKANSAYFVKSTLKATDVTKATCKLSADKKYYEITITVVNETNPLKGKSALSRFTNDFKDKIEMQAGLEDAGASVESITLKTTSVVISARIAVDNQRFNSVKYSIKTDATLTGVKYTIVKVSKATGKIDTAVIYSSFAY